MNTSSKLTEKATRIPDTRPAQWQEAIAQYLRDAEHKQSEAARATRFAMLLQNLLGDQPGFSDYTAGIEQFMHAKQKGGVLRGRADNLYGNLIIEFESAIPKKLGEATEQIRRYAAIQWSQEAPGARTPFIGLATDGVRFHTYTPAMQNPAAVSIAPDEVTLDEIEKSDWSQLPPESASTASVGPARL